MSHVVSSPVIITNIECLKRALAKFPKLKFIEGAKTYEWWGRWENDYAKEDAAYKLGIDPSQYGKCEHKLHMDGVEYEIGICKRKDGQGWSPVWDFVSDGYKLSAYIGDGAEKLMSEYSRQFVLMHAEQEGLSCSQQETEDSIVLEMEVQA